jgi:asparagine synthase (glutamine-hydrolysing)
VWVRAAAESGASEHGGLFRADAVEQLVRDHLERRANLGYHLWGLMILFLWMKKWRIQTGAVPSAGRAVTGSVLTST